MVIKKTFLKLHLYGSLNLATFSMPGNHLAYVATQGIKLITQINNLRIKIKHAFDMTLMKRIKMIEYYFNK